MAVQVDESKMFYPGTQIEWRNWLEKNHLIEDYVWLVQYKKSSTTPSISWSDAVDEALCFGWIDSIKKKLDDERSVQFFSKRKAQGTWSKINKVKVERLMAEGLMADAGLKMIEIAKQNGSWTILDEVEELIIPKDLETAFSAHPNSKDFFLSLNKTRKKMILQWIVLAKRSETREKRISEIAELASQELTPKHVP